MLGRKQSLRTEALLSDLPCLEESANEEGADRVHWVNRTWVRRLLRICALLSLMSLCANTPYTFVQHPSLVFITLGVDALVACLFTLEMLGKMCSRGLWSGDQAYLHSKWCQFDCLMVFCHWLSIGLHVAERAHLVSPYSKWSIIRSPRGFIMIRALRVFFRVSMPKQRINQIFKRSSQQIYNVTLFFLFFMMLYGFLGVQLLGPMNHHCVRAGAVLENLTLEDLAIPDSHCSPDPRYGHHCGDHMVCLDMGDLPEDILGFCKYDDILHSFFTVYQAATQEGWSYLMYEAMDSLPIWRAAVYYVTLMFFIAWLVKNVFIAVITETFNEIRVQFQQMWGERRPILAADSAAWVLRGDDAGWRLVQQDEQLAAGRFRAPACVRRFLQSATFNVLIMLAILVNAVFSASVRFEHDGSRATEQEFYETYFWSEVAFTLLFDLECLVKIWCYGFASYKRRSLHKFELCLAVGSTLHLLPPFFLTMLDYFQVLRIVRLIKASPILEEFVTKIFGPGKKLGSIILFTLCLLLITSSISMQLFCSLAEAHYKRFQDFQESFMSMFQILTQEGWTELMNETMHWHKRFGPALVAIYFVTYHLFVSLIVLSLFVAVILDNLEVDEDVKRVKQLRAREASAGISEDLPWRLRVFERFKDSPQMAAVSRAAADFSVPKVRDSFLRSFVDQVSPDADLPTMKQLSGGPEARITFRKRIPVRLLTSPNKVRTATSVLQKNTVNMLIQDCNNQRLLFGDSGQLFPLTKSKGRDGPEGGKLTRYDRSVRRSVRGSIKIKNTAYEHLRENGLFDGGGGGGEGGGTGAGAPGGGRSPHDFDIKLLQRKRQQAEMRRTQREDDLRENHPFFDTPLLLVGRESRFRKFCQFLVYSRYDPRLRDPVTGKERIVRYKPIHNLIGLVPYLDWCMILITTCSCYSMIMETATYRMVSQPALQVAEYAFVGAMAIELALKTLADGLLFTPKALLRDVTGFMDLFIFGTSLVFLLWMPQEIKRGSLEQLLLLVRCLRPLRIFKLVPHMRRVVYELLRGYKEIILVSILIFLLVFVFACYGVHVYGGKLARCNDPEIRSRDQCVGFYMRRLFVSKMKVKPSSNQRYPSILVPRVWANPRRFNFDNIGNAMLALFEVLSFKGWPDIRDVIVKRMGAAHSIYIHVYVFLGAMIGLTLFVGVVIANYAENRGTALLTVDQRRWSDLKKRLKIAQPLHIPARPDHVASRCFFYDIIQHRFFKRLMAFTVLLNSLLLSLSWKSSEPHTPYLVTMSASLTTLFAAEVLFKCAAFTPRGYWQSRRNRYDLFVTVLAVIWTVLHVSFNDDFSHSFGFVVTILRFFTISGKHATLKMLMLTVAVSVYKSFFIIMGMFLLILTYALIGNILFGSVKYGEAMTRHANFRTAFHGILTLFRIVTGEDWNKIMHDGMVGPPFCTLEPEDNYWQTDCGYFFGSIIFFCSFHVTNTYIVLNLLIAIIMENFSLFYSNEQDALLSYADIRNFQITWNTVDVLQRGSIPVRRVRFLIRLLKGRLEVDPDKDRLLFKHMVHELERVHAGEDVTFHDVLNMLSYRSVDIRKSLQLEELMAREELEYMIEEEVAKQTIRDWLDRCLRRIRLERQQQSLIHNLRATNEPLLQALKDPASGLAPFGLHPESPTTSAHPAPGLGLRGAKSLSRETDSSVDEAAAAAAAAGLSPTAAAKEEAAAAKLSTTPTIAAIAVSARLIKKKLPIRSESSLALPVSLGAVAAKKFLSLTGGEGRSESSDSSGSKGKGARSPTTASSAVAGASAAERTDAEAVTATAAGDQRPTEEEAITWRTLTTKSRAATAASADASAVPTPATTATAGERGSQQQQLLPHIDSLVSDVHEWFNRNTRAARSSGT